MSEVLLTLPDDLASEAKELGLFKPLLVASLFKEEIRRRKSNRLFATAERLALDRIGKEWAPRRSFRNPVRQRPLRIELRW